MDALSGDEPFTLHPDGLGWLFVSAGLVDGPLPVHYEPHESPFDNPLYGQQSNPLRQRSLITGSGSSCHHTRRWLVGGRHSPSISR